MNNLRWYFGRACYWLIVHLPVPRSFYYRPATEWVARHGMTWFYDEAARMRSCAEAIDIFGEEYDYS